MVLYMPIGTMKTADGHINITAMRDRHYVSLCNVLGLPELINDPRFDTRDKRVERADELMPIIRAEFPKKTTAEWATILTEAEVMNAPVATYADFLADKHVQTVGSVPFIHHPDFGNVPMANIPGATPVADGAALSQAPHIGEHTAELLGEFGYSAQDIAALRDAGAIDTNTISAEA